MQESRTAAASFCGQTADFHITPMERTSKFRKTLQKGSKHHLGELLRKSAGTREERFPVLTDSLASKPTVTDRQPL